LILLALALDGGASSAPHPLEFNREVRPILADRCFRCHGPDSAARKRELRLDLEDGSRALLKDGKCAIVPGDLAQSELARRIQSHDPDEVMPPPSLHRPLSDAEQDTLLRWIREGAKYEKHWAFVAPKRTPGTIDELVRARLVEERLEPNSEADRATLRRRAALALTGLPPGKDEGESYEELVERLLASPRFGEHMASAWLDAARYADTFGYQSDWECNLWPWRDWVIAAFNADMPYDEFVREQLAGDLLPDATQEQRIATAFNRLHRMTNEGGSIDEEFRQEAIADRVSTYGTAVLGLTVECARCHDHKYDPIRQRDFYGLGSFFGAIDEAGTYAYSIHATARPALRLATAEQQAELAKRHAAVVAAEDAFAKSPNERALPAPLKSYPLEGAIDGPVGKATHLDGDSGPSLSDMPAFKRCDPHSLVFWMRCPDKKARATVIHTSTFTIETDQQGYQLLLEDGRLSWQVIHFWPGSAAAIRTKEEFPLGRWVEVALTYDGSSRASGLHVYADGVEQAAEIVRDHLDGPADVHSFQIGFRDRDFGFKDGDVDELRVYDLELRAQEVAQIHAGAPAQPIPATAEARALRDARASEQELLEAIPELMVMEATAHPRPAYVLARGAYDQPDLQQPVAPDRALDALLAFDPAWPHDRLGLADWTLDPRNPLTARVETNRLWAQCFGRGLVATQENFGTQGEYPSHPELLDDLALDFVDSGWDVKALLKRIVLSAAFRRSSTATAEQLERDPENRLLARGPRVRLSAEMLRDQALCAAGLLAEELGGPSVKPWQPPGLWEDAGASGGSYTPDTGANAHRRSLYTFRKRTAPPPDMLLFDAGSREKCLARRQPTNTPLQALVLLNDPVFVECARALAERAAKEAGDDGSERITRAFRLLAGRDPRPKELEALRGLLNHESATSDPLGALTLVCSTLLASDSVVVCR
jgi:hypothetical protein